MTAKGRGSLRSQIVRYSLAGGLIFFLGMLQYCALYAIIPRTRYHAAVTWLLNFVIGTLWTHAIHRFSTFRGSRRLPYIESLLRTYLGYAGIHLVGAALMLVLCDIRGMQYLLGWIITTLTTGLLNFVVMRYFSIVRSGKLR